MTQEEKLIHTNYPVKVYEITADAGRSSDAMINNFHGGGFIKGRLDKDSLFCRKLAIRFSCLVWDVDYSLAPEHPYPRAVNESYALIQYVHENASSLGINPKKIILMGIV